MITIIDYGMGNLSSVAKALRSHGLDVRISNKALDISTADGLILPGVGAFGEAMRNIEKHSLIDPIKKHVGSGKPFLAICLGLQLIFEYSEESPEIPGLGIIRGRCVRFDDTLKVPHMGWNQIHIQKDTPILKGIQSGAYVYFVHSYYVVPEEPVTATITEYGIEFVSSIAKDNVFACQFHPEKSQETGLKMLENFGAMV